MKAMIFAAGLGTRLKPFTDKHPKALAPVNNVPLLQRNIQYLQSYGINDFVINVHHFSDQIIDFLNKNDHFGANIVISDENEQVLETGGGLVFAKDNFDDDFLVMNVDILTDVSVSEFIAFHRENKPLVSLAISDRKSSRKLLFNNDLRLKGWKNLITGEQIVKEGEDYKELAFSGLHIICPEIFNFMPSEGKFSIMKTYMELMSDYPIMGYDHTGSKLIDVGKPESLQLAEEMFQ